MPGSLRIVCIDDEEDDVELIRLALARGAVRADVRRVDDEAALRQCLEDPPQLLLCDYSMPRFSAERALAVVAAAPRPVPLIVVTWAIGEEAVVRLFRSGARDYVAKDKLALLPSVIERVLRERAAEQERQRTAEALETANARLRQLSSHLVDAQERERTVIARELHDSLGQALSGIVIHLHAAGRSGSPSQAEHCRSRALELAQQAIRQVKSMSFHLRPAQLELLGFAAAVQATLDRQLEASGVRGSLRLRGHDPARSAPAQAVALRVLQEALTNVVRHSGAANVVVRLRFSDADHFVLTSSDDGQGFDLGAALAGGLSEENLGLHGMLERAELMGGSLRFRSRPGRGTVVRLCL
jgi:two-component system, NarL family, sensor histidine kinase UhpB